MFVPKILTVKSVIVSLSAITVKSVSESVIVSPVSYIKLAYVTED